MQSADGVLHARELFPGLLADHTVWQNVYRVPHEATVLYVKFTVDVEGHIVISLKEK